MRLGGVPQARSQHRGAGKLGLAVFIGALFFVLLIPSRSFSGGNGNRKDPHRRRPDPSLNARRAKLAGLPLSFEANLGQTDARVKFLSRGRGYTLFLTGSEAVLALRSGQSSVVSSQLSAGRNSKLEIGNWKFETGPDNLAQRRQADFADLTSFFPPFFQSPILNHQSPIQPTRTPNPESLIPAALRLKLVGANPKAKVVGLDPLPGRSNYFIGNDPKKWRTNVPNYARVKYENVYPGIDVVYYGKQGQLEYDFVVRPGADPRAIRFAVETAKAKLETGNWKLETGNSKFENGQSKIPNPKSKIAPNGDLIISLGEAGAGEVRFHKPLVYQEQLTVDSRELTGKRTSALGAQPSARRLLTSSFIIHRSSLPSSSARYEVAFEVSSYDPTKPLVIDPVLSYSTFLGGSSGEVAHAVAVDALGNMYLAGETGSTAFPTTTGALQTANGGDSDVFVTKLSAAGDALVYSTYLGGTGTDRARGLALDASGSAYVTGETASANFPTTSGTLQTTFGGGTDAFAAKLNADGTALTYSTYLGGSDVDSGQGIALDADGNAFLVGSTRSTAFPTASPLQAANAGESDAFVAKLNAAGSALTYSTYVGGTAVDYGQGIAVDSSGNAYVAGYTFSSNFPTANALQTANAGLTDAFVAKVNAAGSVLMYSTYLGGSGFDRALGIARDGAGNVYVTGDTASADFPATSGALLGASDAFLTELNATGLAVVYSTFLGGSSSERGAAVALDGAGNAFVTGFTASADFPVVSALQATFGGGTCGSDPCSDAFVTELGSGGSSLVYSTFLGTGSADEGDAITVDSSGNVYVAGGTSSFDFPVTSNAYQPELAGIASLGDVFVAKIGPADAPSVALHPKSLSFGDQPKDQASAPKTISLKNYGTGTLTISSITPDGDFAETDDCGGSVAPGAASCTVSVTFTPTDIGARTGTLTITDDAAGSPRTIALSGNGTTPAPDITFSPANLDFADQTFQTTSDPPQTVTMTNSGSADLTITEIKTTGDFAQTNDCPATVTPGTSCTISVTFTPTATGSRTGTVTVTSDVSGAPRAVTLKGTGIAVFSLSADNTSATVSHTTTSTTFTIAAAAPADFTGDINLSCSAITPATCSFSPTSITAGQTSTLTVNGLTQITGTSLKFGVDGTSGGQSTTLAMSILFSDYSLTATPTYALIVSGQSAVYTVNATPVNGFDQKVTFSCKGAPREATCKVSPDSVTLDGTNAAPVTVTLKTTASTLAPPRPGPPSRLPRAGVFSPFAWMVALLGLGLLGFLSRLRSKRHAWPAMSVPFAAILLMVLLWTACSFERFGPETLVTGTPPGTYALTVSATYGTMVRSVPMAVQVQ